MIKWYELLPLADFSQTQKIRGPWTRYVLCKAMKSSPLLGPFCGSEFWAFSLLNI